MAALQAEEGAAPRRRAVSRAGLPNLEKRASTRRARGSWRRAATARITHAAAVSLETKENRSRKRTGSSGDGDGGDASGRYVSGLRPPRLPARRQSPMQLCNVARPLKESRVRTSRPKCMLRTMMVVRAPDLRLASRHACAALEARVSRQTRAPAKQRDRSLWVQMQAPAATRRGMSATAAPELDTHGFAMAKSARYADSHEQALAQCVEDVMGQLQRKGCADAHNIVSVLWVSENNQVPHTSLAGFVSVRLGWIRQLA